MTPVEIISLVVTFIGVASFAAVFTILYQSYATSTVNELNIGKRDIELIDEIIYEKQEVVQKRRKRTNTIKTVAFYIALIFIIPIFVFSLINKFQGQTTMIGDKTIMVVASGSMSEKHETNTYLNTYNLNNQFQTYDIIVLNKATNLKLYDVIAFKNDEGINVIHRIIKINPDGTFTTKGDANRDNDSYKPSMKDVIGVYSDQRIVVLGIFVIFFQSYPGMVTIAALVYCLVMVDRVTKRMNKAEAARVAHLAEIIEQIRENEEEKDISATYKEIICYKGYAYHFDEKGFISKEEIKDKDIIKTTDDTVIKVKENDDTTKTVEKIKVDEETSKGEDKNEN